MIVAFMKVVLQFAIHAHDPHWACEITHRDPGLSATFLLYCSQILPDGTEIISVGKYLPDAPAPIKMVP
jgi:hypothetical protein